MRKKFLAIPLLAALAAAFFWYKSATKPLTLTQQREQFLVAEKAITANNKTDFQRVSAKLVNYPLYPYLQYQWLKNKLDNPKQIATFLTQYKDNHYAELLRTKWLTALAEQQRWPEFIKYYQNNDDKDLACQFHWTTYQMGKQDVALTEALALWAMAESQPKTCAPLFAAVAASGKLAPDVIWQHFEDAIKADNINEATTTLNLFNKDDQVLANKWLQVQKTPEIIQRADFWPKKDAAMGRLFAYGIDKLIKPNINLALSVWDKQKHSFTLDTTASQPIEHRLALALAMRRDHRAFDRFMHVSQPNEELRSWGLRSALFTHNWKGIIQAYQKFSATEQQDPHWQYWLGRAYNETGDKSKAHDAYSLAAKDRGFFGFLAADAINQPYQFNDKPITLTDEALATLRQSTELAVLEEFKALKHDTDARRHWPDFIKKLSKDQITLAAKLAERWRWHQLAIITLTKADYWDDLTLRFPVDYQAPVESNAALNELDPAVVFGLMRQESMMDTMATSTVGAKGLMQLMPGTGQLMAKTLGEQWHSDTDLYKPELNIKYGSHYYKQLLNQFNGQFALATAAYNAGPNRVNKWLPKDKAMPIDLWVEYIPFKETRKYVSSVLSYAIIYQYRLQRNTLKLKNLLPDVAPAKN